MKRHLERVRSTTILAVRRDGEVALGGDGQVTVGQTVMKSNAQKVRTRVDRIKTVVEQGAGIVKAMLGFSRESEQQASLCDLKVVVEDTIKLLGDRFLHEVQVSFDAGHDLSPVVCPKDFVQQILINFIFNAAESMDTHKQIILATQQLDTLPHGLVPAAVTMFVLPPQTAVTVLL